MSQGQASHVTFQEVMLVDPPCAASTPYATVGRDFIFDNVWSRPGLSRRDRRFVTLASVCAADAVGPIDDQVYAALASGDISLDEMMEFTLHFAIYCGWPKGSQVEAAVRNQAARVAKERGEELTWPELSIESLGPNDHEERLAGGEKCFVDVNYIPSPPRDSPYFHAGILGFVFGHLWQRPNLGRRERRLITIACVGVSDAIGPIYSHVGSALESGDVTFEEMQEIVLQFSAYSGFAKGEVLERVALESWNRICAK